MCLSVSCIFVTLMGVLGIISAPVIHLFPTSEVKLNLSIVNTVEGNGLMKPFETFLKVLLNGNK